MGEQLGELRLRENIDPEVERHPDGSTTESAIYIDSETDETVESTKHRHPDGDLNYETETRIALGSGERTGHLSLRYWPGGIVAHKNHTFIDRETAEDIELVKDFYPDGGPRRVAETRHKPGGEEEDDKYWLQTWGPDRVLLLERRTRLDAEADQWVILEKENFPDGSLKLVSETRRDRETGLAVKTLVENYWQDKLNSAKEGSVNPETGKTVEISREYRPEDGSLKLASGEWIAHNDNESVDWTHHYSESEVLTHGIAIRTDLETGDKQVMPDDYTEAIATQTTEQLAALGKVSSD